MDGWSRVVAAVVDRRAELGWTQKELAGFAGVSERTVQNLEAGVRPQARNRHKIERALGWGNGDMRRIEEEGERSPPPLPRELPPDLQELMRDQLGDEMAAELIAHYGHMVSGRLPPPGEAARRRERGGGGQRSAS